MVKERIVHVTFRYSSGKTILLDGRAAEEWEEMYKQAVTLLIEKLLTKGETATTPASLSDIPPSLRELLGTPTRGKDEKQ